MKEIPSHLKPYRKEIEATLKPAVCIKVSPGKTKLWESKFGGDPYLPKGLEYPISNTSSKHLFLLAQINFEEIPALESFPPKGILQIFISDEYEIGNKRTKSNLWGMNESDQTDQDHFRIIYHADIIKDTDKLVTNFSFLPGFHFGSQELQLIFEKEYQLITNSDFRFEELERRLRRAGYKGILPSGGITYDQLGGYHYSQNGHDPRYDEFIEEESILLLQIHNDYISWGDLGAAQFFITEKALKELDFSNVIYHWDCT